MAVKIRLADSRIGIRNAFTRMPFRFGVVTMRASPLCTLEVVIEDEAGRQSRGYAADLLAYRWFDKRPDKTLADNVADLLHAIDVALSVYRDAAAKGPASPFDLWRETFGEIERRCLADGFNPLGASFGVSMLERAVLDGVGRMHGLSYRELVTGDALGIRLDRVFPELAGLTVGDVVPARPLDRVNIRHTVGLLDPIACADIGPGDRVDDGLPESLEEYLRVDGIRYLKIKVSGVLDDDLARLQAISDVIFAIADTYVISLDGNEQYKQISMFSELVEAIKERPSLRRLFDAIRFIEQPLDRSVAMDPAIASDLERLGRIKPVIIDEADGWVTAFREAMDLGYAGVSHKNCKGIYKSLCNLALAHRRNDGQGPGRYFLSAEDLTNLPVVALNADLASVALLGIDHVERNGHHYFLGLGHLPADEQRSALADHPDLYTRHGDHTVLRIADGQLAIASLQTAGMGFATPPDMETMTAPEAWSFESLGETG